MNNKIIREIYLDNLPKKEGIGKNKGKQVIDWKNAIGKKINFYYDDIQGQIKIMSYESKKSYLCIKYKDNIVQIDTYNFKRCKLGKLLKKRTSEFKVEIGKSFKDNKRNLIIIDREYRERKKYYRYKCNKCGWDKGWIIESDLLNKKGCSCCRGFTIVAGINDIPTTAPWMVKYFQGGYDEAKLYTKGSKKEIYPICPNCGRIKNKTICISDIYRYNSINCICNDGISYPEKFMFNVLEQLNIDFKKEYSPNWIRPKRYDFYFEINSKKYIIEMDSKFHKEGNSMRNETKEESKFIDDFKDLKAKEHNIDVIRINCTKSYFSFIKNNIIESKLSQILTLNDIDWIKCEKFSLVNEIEQACRIKRDRPNITTTEIGKIMKLNRCTVREYLKKGNEIWDWANYSPEEETEKTLIKGREICKRPIKVFKNDISLGIFESAIEVERESEKLFGVKLSSRHIPSVCKGKRQSHKGYTFEYV
ncbi:hypothetical protein FCV38_11995 [Clostridium sporogenes]|nr:hypothetical protein [Clostridium sporogenes]